MRTGFVTGLRAEARCLPRDAPVACSGASAVRAAGEARRLLALGCGALVSFGLAGALWPRLSSGDLVVADHVVCPDGTTIGTDRSWTARLRRRVAGCGLRVRGGTVAGSDRLIDAPAAKRALFERTGAAAVDMESHGVARAALEAGVPVIVVRAISDPDDRHLPALAMQAVRPDGGIRGFGTVWSLLRRPRDLPALLRLARDTGRALGTLRRVVDAAGPTFASDGAEQPREPPAPAAPGPV